MESVTAYEVDRGGTQQHGEAVEARARADVHQACKALGGAHGLQRKVAKRELLEAMDRLQRLIDCDYRECSSSPSQSQ